MFELSIQDDISSAHFLRGYEGKCKELHGHNWKIEIVVMGSELDNLGMLADFGILKEKLKEAILQLDHVCLNDLEAFQASNPTTENIAKYLFKVISNAIDPIKLKNIKVWESDTSSVVYYE